MKREKSLRQSPRRKYKTKPLLWGVVQGSRKETDWTGGQGRIHGTERKLVSLKARSWAQPAGTNVVFLSRSCKPKGVYRRKLCVGPWEAVVKGTGGAGGPQRREWGVQTVKIDNSGGEEGDGLAVGTEGEF